MNSLVAVVSFLEGAIFVNKVKIIGQLQPRRWRWTIVHLQLLVRTFKGEFNSEFVLRNNRRDGGGFPSRQSEQKCDRILDIRGHDCELAVDGQSDIKDTVGFDFASEDLEREIDDLVVICCFGCDARSFLDDQSVTVEAEISRLEILPTSFAPDISQIAYKVDRGRS